MGGGVGDVDTNTALGGREGLQTSRPSARQPASPVVGDGRCQWNLHHAGGMFFFFNFGRQQ